MEIGMEASLTKRSYQKRPLQKRHKGHIRLLLHKNETYNQCTYSKVKTTVRTNFSVIFFSFKRDLLENISIDSLANQLGLETKPCSNPSC